MRFDVALAELRLIKSRSQASLAIQEGSALLNGARAKASHAVRPGDRVTLITPHGSRTLEVIELPTRSLSKEAAKALVREVAR
jgi:ribosome-associated heat shock protein Hsp15